MKVKKKKTIRTITKKGYTCKVMKIEKKKTITEKGNTCKTSKACKTIKMKKIIKTNTCLVK
jgi:hypothetical protein